MGQTPQYQHSTATSPLTHFIRTFDNLLPEPFCEAVIEEYSEPNGLWEDSFIYHELESGDSVKDDTWRTSSQLNISLGNVINVNPGHRRQLDIDLFSYVGQALNAYMNIFGDVSVRKDNGYTLLRYGPNEFYKEHYDYVSREQAKGADAGEVRELTLLIQLNSDFEGGGLTFFNDTFRIPVSTGSATIFPSSFMFPHQALPVKSGTRYAIVSWFH